MSENKIKVRLMPEKEVLARCHGYIALFGWEPYEKSKKGLEYQEYFEEKVK